jgi:hypothetical protein
MNKNLFFSFLILFPILMGCSAIDKKSSDLVRIYPKSFKISVKNPISSDRIDEAVVLSVPEIKAVHPVFNPGGFVVLAGKQELASQVNDLNGDQNPDEIVFVADFKAGQKRKLTIRYSAEENIQPRHYPKRTQAELSHKFGGEFVNRVYQGGDFQNVQYLRVPPEHTDHSWFIRYEGPGWESDKVGYRFYLDWRNAIDIFGKKVPDMVLQNVGLDGFDSYHEMSDWGMDIFKVGESFGIGSIGMWQDGKAERVSVTDSVICEIVSNGPVQSQIRTRYYGWKVGPHKSDLISDLSIAAGSRMTKHTLQIQGNVDNLCTGLVKHEDTQLFRSRDPDSEWAYLALYGKQSLAGDNLGIAVLYRNQDLIEITEDEYNHVVVLKPKDGMLTYYFGAAWEQEPNGIQSREAFETCLDQTIAGLNAPLIIKL